MNNVNLSGEFASSLPQTNLSSTDFLLVSEPILKTRLNGQYASKHIEFNKLSSTILENIRSLQKFGSMAFEETSSYSLIDHDHSFYSKATISSLLSASDNTELIGSVTIDGEKTELYAPKIHIKQIHQPLLGQIKLVHHIEAKGIDIMADDFDGWVYANGATYDMQQFDKAISAVFENDGMLFSVPNLNAFIKPNPTPYSQNDMSQKYDHVDPLHSHDINMNLSGEVNGSLYYNYAVNGDGNTSHGINQQGDTRIYTIELDYSNIKVSSKSKNYIKPAKSDAVDTYPSHISIPAMVYIGIPI